MSTPAEDPVALNSPTATETTEAEEARLADLKMQLAEVEQEMDTLRAVLQSKQEKAQELRRQLGISPLVEFKNDLEQSIKNIQDTQAYQKTTDVVKSAGEKTTQLFGSIGRKIGEMKNSPTYRSIEERMGSAYTNVRSTISSRSNSLYSFNGDTSAAQTPAQEDKTLINPEVPKV